VGGGRLTPRWRVVLLSAANERWDGHRGDRRRHAHDDRRLIALAIQSHRARRDWEERFGTQLLSRDGVVALGPPARRRLELMRSAEVRARLIGAEALSERLPLLARWDEPAVLDEDGGAIRTQASIHACAASRLIAWAAGSIRAARSGQPAPAPIRCGVGGIPIKHAPALGRAPGRAALGGGLAPSLHPEARLGAELFESAEPVL
jgi:sarcosine oxidase